LQQSITETRRIEIPSRLSMITFQFAALSFRDRSLLRFRNGQSKVRHSRMF